MVTLFSCTEKINVTNFDFKPTIQTPSGSVTNVEQPLQFTITVTGLDESTSEELEVSFSIKDGIGKYYWMIKVMIQGRDSRIIL